MPPLSYRGCWHRVSRGFLHRYSQRNGVLTRTHSSRSTGVYDPRAFILHAALLRQGFPHCGKFPTAASRRSLGRVSVPVWPSALSGRLPIEALVGHYPANKLIGRGLLLKRQALRSPALIFGTNRRCHAVLAPVSRCYSPLEGRSPTRYSPVRRSTRGPKSTFALDLHVLGTPPALILSQDQTLELKLASDPPSPEGSGKPKTRQTPKACSSFRSCCYVWKYSLGLFSLYLVFKEQTPLGAISQVNACKRYCQGKNEPNVPGSPSRRAI